MRRVVLAAILATGVLAGSAVAGPWTAPGAALQGVFDGITVNPNPGDSSVNVAADYLADGSDAWWDVTGSGGSVTTFVIELAGWKATNTFGIYDPVNLATVQIFSGSDTAGAQKLLSITDDGSVLVNFVDTGVDLTNENFFGYYLDATPTGGAQAFWYSDTLLNSDDEDHMVAYQGNNIDTIKIPGWAAGLFDSGEFILAWEDLPNPNGVGADWKLSLIHI